MFTFHEQHVPASTFSPSWMSTLPVFESSSPLWVAVLACGRAGALS